MALTDNILAYWNLNNDGSGGVSLVDSTGNGNGLTNSGTTLGAGIILGAGAFTPSSTSSLSCGAISGLSTGDYAVSFWVNPFTFNGYQGLISVVNAFNCYINNNSSLSLNNAQSGSNIEMVGSLPANDWSHIVVNCVSGVTSLFLNGAFVASTTQQIRPSGNTIYIGNFGGFQWTIDGLMDEVGIWGRALSPSEITTLYGSGAGITYPFDALYFNAAVDGNFGTLGNYWEDSAFTIPAAALPTTSDFVFILASATSGTLTCDSASVVGVSIGSSASIVGNATLSGNASNSGTITGNVVVAYPAQNPIGGTISGTITYSYPNGNGAWGSIYYINGEATTLDLDGNGVWQGVTYVNGVPQYAGVFFTNASGNGDFHTLSNWNFLPDGSGASLDGIPWTNDGTGGFWYSELDLFAGDNVYAVFNYFTIGGSGITGTCDISGFTNYGNIYGGAFSGANFTNGLNIFGGIFSGAIFTNFGGIYGGTFSGVNFFNSYGNVVGGTFIQPAVTPSTSSGMTMLSMSGGPTFSYPTPPAPSGGGGGIDIARLIGLPPFIQL